MPIRLHLNKVETPLTHPHNPHRISTLDLAQGTDLPCPPEHSEQGGNGTQTPDAKKQHTTGASLLPISIERTPAPVNSIKTKEAYR